LIDDVLSTQAVKSGYQFTAVGVAGSGTTLLVTYTATAVPSVVGQSGQRAFLTDQSGVIRYDASGAAATASSPAL
jgi:hypothetical protein